MRVFACFLQNPATNQALLLPPPTYTHSWCRCLIRAVNCPLTCNVTGALPEARAPYYAALMFQQARHRYSH